MKYFIKAMVILMTISIFAPAALAEQTQEERLEGLCTEGNSTACFKMGERHRIVERDEKTALKFYEKACDAGYMTGCTNGGILLAKKSTPYSKGFKQARKMFDKACEARMFSNGDNGQGELEMARWQAINIGATDIILLFGYTFITPFKRI